MLKTVCARTKFYGVAFSTSNVGELACALLFSDSNQCVRCFINGLETYANCVQLCATWFQFLIFSENNIFLTRRISLWCFCPELCLEILIYYRIRRTFGLILLFVTMMHVRTVIGILFTWQGSRILRCICRNIFFSRFFCLTNYI